MPQFRDRWQRRSTMFGKDPRADLPILFRKRQDDFIYEESEDNNEGITAVAWASVMHVWAPDYVEMVYPRARDQILRRTEDGTLGVNLAGYFAKYKEYQRNPGHHATDPMMVGVHIFGTLALAAAELSAPELCDVDFPAVLVREATYPGKGARLRVTLAPGDAGAGRRTVAVRRLDLDRELRVSVDGFEIMMMPGQDEATAGDVSLRADRAAGLLRLTLMLDRDRRIDIR